MVRGSMSVLFGLRFDFRNPAFAGTTCAERYAAALDMAEWADGLGCVSIALSEHHGSPDGYLPSPLTMLAAMAARTTNVRFLVAALVAPFYDPLRLAEDLVVLDPRRSPCCPNRRRVHPLRARRVGLLPGRDAAARAPRPRPQPDRREPNRGPRHGCRDGLEADGAVLPS